MQGTGVLVDGPVTQSSWMLSGCLSRALLDRPPRLSHTLTPPHPPHIIFPHLNLVSQPPCGASLWGLPVGDHSVFARAIAYADTGYSLGH